MELPVKYNPLEVEDKWYAYWLKNKYFHSEPDEREPYTIVIPPPNVTGVLHMGHMLNNTIQDVLVRRARMNGTDHASIATEAKVVAKLKEQGIEKSSLTREEFLKHAWEWKEKHGGIILEQLKKLGASCDWDRTKFTMDEPLSEAVINIDYANNIVIVRTMQGMAQGVAFAIENIHYDGMMGTIAGDDTIMMVTKTEENAKNLVNRIKNF